MKSIFSSRRSLRLKTYDYSSEGMYFVTICVNKKFTLFGRIEEDKVKLNEAGQMIGQWWRKIPDKFSAVSLNEYIIMPNHIHGIISIVGAIPCVYIIKTFATLFIMTCDTLGAPVFN